jgi:hypothetical protein
VVVMTPETLSIVQASRPLEMKRDKSLPDADEVSLDLASAV